MRLWTSPMLRSSKVPTPQGQLRNLKAIESLGNSLACWAHNLMELIGDKITQAKTHTQMDTSNHWNEMVSRFLCLVFFY